MYATTNLHVLFTIFAITIAQVCSGELMCYVCEDCSKITQNTTQLACNEAFFEKDLPGTGMTESYPTTPVATSTTTLTPTPTPTPPQPPTAGPVQSTTSLPTPPNPGTAPSIELSSNETTTNQSETKTTTESSETSGESTLLPLLSVGVESAEIRVRQRRSIAGGNFTYHCYSIEEKVNNTISTSRGCSRVGPSEGVCEQLQGANNETTNTNCYACSNSLCNSSNAIGASIGAILSGLVAALLLRSFA